jgi:hypothetical protein
MFDIGGQRADLTPAMATDCSAIIQHDANLMPHEMVTVSIISTVIISPVREEIR